jgi:hypothetical protein
MYSKCIVKKFIIAEKMVFKEDDISANVEVDHSACAAPEHETDVKTTASKKEQDLVDEVRIEEVNSPTMDLFTSRQKSFRQGFIRYNGYIMPRCYLKVLSSLLH